MKLHENCSKDGGHNAVVLTNPSACAFIWYILGLDQVCHYTDAGLSYLTFLVRSFFGQMTSNAEGCPFQFQHVTTIKQVKQKNVDHYIFWLNVYTFLLKSGLILQMKNKQCFFAQTVGRLCVVSCIFCKT